MSFSKPKIIYFVQKKPIKVKILRISSTQIKIHKILVIFETKNQSFLPILHNSSVTLGISSPNYFS